MSNIHMTLQGKGGVGKSFISSLIMQFLLENEKPVIGIDTDPVNQTFKGYSTLNVRHLSLLEKNEIVARNFDNLMETILSTDSHFVIDNGAATFLPLSHYLKENYAFNILSDAGKSAIIHTVITGGQSMHDTLVGLSALCEEIPETAQIIVWKNEYFGEIKAENKNFEDLKVYKANSHRISTIITIPRQSDSTFGEDIKSMLNQKLTFEEISNSKDFSIMSKSRLLRIKKMIFDQVSQIPGII